MNHGAVALLGLGLLLGGCSGDGRPEPSRSEPDAAPSDSPIRLVRADAIDALVRPHVGGSPTVDYIIDSLGSGGAWLDYDNDGDPDLYLAQGATIDRPADGPPDQLLRNDGSPDGGPPSFTDVTEAAGLGDRRWSFGVATADYDNDGDPDIYLANWGENRLYRNNGDGTFTDLAREAGVADRRWGVSAAWSDTDRDGDLDLYVTNYVEFEFDRYPARGEPSGGGGPPCVWKSIEVFCGPRNLEASEDAFYRNDGDPDGDGVPSFVDATQSAGLALDEPLYGLAVHFFDADNDGDDDLYVANDSVMNNYFVNRGDGTFEDQAILTGLAYNEQGNEQAGMGVAAGDVNGDGLLDLAVTNFSHDHDTVYRNDGGLFTDVSYSSGIGSASFLTLAWGVSFVDLDQDGREDLAIAQGHVYPQVDGREIGTSFRQPNRIYRNVDGQFEELPAGSAPALAVPKSSRALMPVDVEGDGDIDLLLTNLNDRPDLLLNESPAGNWLQVRLVGQRSNRDGIGARIVATVGGRNQMREIRRNTGFAASSLPVAHFGLGTARSVDELEVRWPSGLVSRLEQVAANRQLTVRESDAR